MPQDIAYNLKSNALGRKILEELHHAILAPI